MSRESFVVLFGVLVVFLPVLGFPPVWKQWTLVGIGVLITVVGYSLRRSAYYRRTDRGNGERGTDSFVESQPSLLDKVDESHGSV